MLLVTMAGCLPNSNDALRIACPWPSGERQALTEDFRAAHPDAPPIAWVALWPGDDPERAVRGLAVDLVLGLPSQQLDRINVAGLLIPFDPTDRRPWRVARRQAVGVAVNVQRAATPADRKAFDDPRRDPLTFAWMKARIGPTGAGYRALVRLSAESGSIGRRAGSAVAAVGRGEAIAGPASGVEGAIDERMNLVADHPSDGWIEGVALIAGRPREAEARRFVAYLAERGQAEPTNRARPTPADLAADSLMADLLGATLVDAHEELVDAADALARDGWPTDLDLAFGEPPPWPPTSVAKLLGRPDAAGLLAALAGEIVDDPEARAWLLDSWEHPARPIDLAWLAEVAGAAGGRLAAEPRFHVWLRAEWTAWARQQGRRIAREAARRRGAG